MIKANQTNILRSNLNSANIITKQFYNSPEMSTTCYIVSAYECKLLVDRGHILTQSKITQSNWEW